MSIGSYLWRVDGYVLQRIERMARAVQMRTGWNNFAQARAVIGVALVSVLVSVVLNGISTTELVAWCFFYGMLYAYAATVLTLKEHIVLEDLARGYENIGKLDGLALAARWSSLAFALLYAGVLAHVRPGLFALDIVLPMYFTLLSLATFLSVCTPLPPCRGTWREKLASLFMKPAFNA